MNIGDLICEARSRRFSSLHAGCMPLYNPGVAPVPYHPTPKPSPLVVVSPARAARLWSINECLGLKSSSSRYTGPPEYAIQRHMGVLRRSPASDQGLKTCVIGLIGRQGNKAQQMLDRV